MLLQYSTKSELSGVNIGEIQTPKRARCRIGLCLVSSSWGSVYRIAKLHRSYIASSSTTSSTRVDF